MVKFLEGKLAKSDKVAKINKLDKDDNKLSGETTKFVEKNTVKTTSKVAIASPKKSAKSAVAKVNKSVVKSKAKN